MKCRRTKIYTAYEDKRKCCKCGNLFGLFVNSDIYRKTSPVCLSPVKFTKSVLTRALLIRVIEVWRILKRGGGPFTVHLRAFTWDKSQQSTYPFRCQSDKIASDRRLAIAECLRKLKGKRLMACNSL